MLKTAFQTLLLYFFVVQTFCRDIKKITVKCEIDTFVTDIKDLLLTAHGLDLIDKLSIPL